jgi:hypothetical protein
MSMAQRTVLLIFFIILLFCSDGCEKENAVEAEATITVPENLLPLVAGHRLVYDGYLTFEGTENEIAGSDVQFHAAWTITTETPLAAVISPAPEKAISEKSSAVLIVDTVYVPGFMAEPNVSPVFVYYDASGKEYHYLTNFGYVFRKYAFLDTINGSVRGDSLRFLTLASPKAGIGKSFNVFEGTFNSYFFGSTIPPVSLTINVTGTFEAREKLTLNVNGVDTTFTTYKLTIRSVASIPGIEPQTSLTARFWLAEGIGPVQMFLAGDAEGPGSFRRLSGKNF